MGGTRRRVARSGGDGGPSAWLVAVKRRSVGDEPTRRRAWIGESSTDAASVENLGDMGFSSCVGNLSVADATAAGRDRTGATARIAGDDEGPAGRSRMALRGWKRGRCDHGHSLG